MNNHKVAVLLIDDDLVTLVVSSERVFLDYISHYCMQNLT